MQRGLTGVFLENSKKILSKVVHWKTVPSKAIWSFGEWDGGEFPVGYWKLQLEKKFPVQVPGLDLVLEEYSLPSVNGCVNFDVY
ncbi:hypothetical protein Trydic_g22234 [Trypoxylus dichotomus]